MEEEFSEETIEFAFALAEEGVENYPAKIEKVEKASDTKLRISLVINSNQKEIVNALIETIKEYNRIYKGANEVILIPTRRWSIRVAKKVPQVFDRLIKTVLEAVEKEIEKEKETEERRTSYIG